MRGVVSVYFEHWMTDYTGIQEGIFLSRSNRWRFITSVACKKPSSQPKENGLHHPRPGLQPRFLGCIDTSSRWNTWKQGVTICRWYVPPRSSSGVGEGA